MCPLGIELAAARVRALPVEDIAARLDDRFRLLTDGGRTALPRHQTLRSLIDWSHGLLTHQEQILLHRLSVFAGGWTLPAAEEVCSDAGVESAEILDLLTHLVDKSLVSLDHAGPVSHYRMLETIREYGWEKLTGSGEVEALRDRHLNYIVGFVQEAESQYHAVDEAVWCDRLEQEIANLRTALEWGSSLDSPGTLLSLSSGLAWFWWVRGHILEAITWLTRALARPAADKPMAERSKALTALGWLRGAFGEYDGSQVLFKESVMISRKLDDRRALAETLSTWCQWIVFYSPNAASPILEEALEISREVGYKLGTARSLIGRGQLQSYEGDDEAAQETYDQCATLFRELGEKDLLAYVVRRLGHIALRKRDFQIASALFADSLRLNAELKNPHGIAACFTAFGSVAAQQGNAVRAAQLYGAAAVVLESYGGKLVPVDEIENEPHRLVSHAALNEKGYERAASEGRSMGLREAIAFALGNSYA